MKIFCTFFGTGLAFILMDYKKNGLADSIAFIILNIILSFLVAGIISMMYPAFCPTTEADYSFNIYSIGKGEQFIIEENDGYYTYNRKFSSGIKTESIPVDKTFIVYDDNKTPSVRAQGEKLFDNSKIRGKNIFFFDGQDPSSLQIEKYTMTLPTNAVVR